MRRGARPRWWIAWLLALLPHQAWAHAEPYSWVDVHLEPETWSCRVTVHVVDLAHEVGLVTPDSILQPSYLRRHAAEYEPALARRFRLEVDGEPWQPHWTESRVVPERQAVAFEFDAGSTPHPHRLRLQGPLFDYESFHATYFNVYESGRVRHQDVLDQRRPASTFTRDDFQSRFEVIRRFLLAGVHHIFIGPDHILFIVGLLLLGGGVRRLLKIVTAFTVAHSVTLALAATELVTPPTRLVEPAIALSIVTVGAANLMSGANRRDRRIWVAAIFGLVHGFGFASVLRQLGLPRQALAWSLFSFNAGVEVGQACIVLAVAPMLAAMRARRPQVVPRIVTVGSLLVVAAGSYWFVQRAWFA